MCVNYTTFLEGGQFMKKWIITTQISIDGNNFFFYKNGVPSFPFPISPSTPSLSQSATCSYMYTVMHQQSKQRQAIQKFCK